MKMSLQHLTIRIKILVFKEAHGIRFQYLFVYLLIY